MKTERERLLRSKNYIVAQIQLRLLNIIGAYKESKNLKDYQLANELGVSKGYISQILNASFDHKITKIVDLALACNKMPLIYFVDMDEFIMADKEDKVYELMQMQRHQYIKYSKTKADIKSRRKSYELKQS